MEARTTTKTCTLIGPDGKPYTSATPGMLGGHRGLKGYGRLNCPSAPRWIAKGHYVAHRVFFADEATALTAGYRPCAVCLPERYRTWKRARERAREQARRRIVPNTIGRTGETTNQQAQAEYFRGMHHRPCVTVRA